MRHYFPSPPQNFLLSARGLIQQGQPEHAKREYLRVLCELPDEPLALLCTGIAQIAAAMSRTVPDRHRAVLQAFALLQAIHAMLVILPWPQHQRLHPCLQIQLAGL